MPKHRLNTANNFPTPTESHHPDDDAVSKKKRKKHHHKSSASVDDEYFRKTPTSYNREDNAKTTTKKSKKQPGPDDPSTDDLNELLRRIEDLLPADDRVSFGTRLAKINWKRVAFAGYTAAQCQSMWLALQKQVRKFRLFGEILADVRRNVATNKPTVHPDKPKYPRSAYMYYFLETKDDFRADNPTLSYGEVLKELGERYKTLDRIEKKRYEKLAADAFADYTERMQIFNQNHPELILLRSTNNNINNNKVLKTPFDLFYLDKLEEEDERRRRRSAPNDSILDGRELKIRCKDEWKSDLTLDEKLYWIQLADEQCKTYYSKQLKNTTTNVSQKKTVLSKKEQLLLDRARGKPLRPPRSGYRLFQRMLFDSGELSSNLNHREKIQCASEQWKKCSMDEQYEYNKRAKQLWRKYDRDFDSFLRTLPARERDQLIKTDPYYKNRMRSTNNNKYVGTTKQSLVVELKKLKRKEPTIPPRTAYEYFRKVRGTRKATRLWVKLTDEEKQVYAEKVVKLKRKYMKKFQRFVDSLPEQELVKYLESSRTGDGNDDSLLVSEGDDCDSDECIDASRVIV